MTLIVSAALVVALAGSLLQPAPSRGYLTSNVVLGSAFVALTLWWGRALWATRGQPVRHASRAAFAAAALTALGFVILSLGRFGVVGSAVRLLALTLVVIAPATWAAALLAWPGDVSKRTGRRTVLELAVLLSATLLLAGDFLLGPTGGLPTSGPGWTTWITWLFLLFCVAVAAFRKSAPGLGLPFLLLMTSLGVVYAGNAALRMDASIPPSLLAWAGLLASVLRLAAAQAVAGATGRMTNRTGFLTRVNSVQCVGWYASALVGAHVLLKPPPWASALWGGIILLIAVLMVHGFTGRRRDGADAAGT